MAALRSKSPPVPKELVSPWTNDGGTRCTLIWSRANPKACLSNGILEGRAVALAVRRPDQLLRDVAVEQAPAERGGRGRESLRSSRPRCRPRARRRRRVWRRSSRSPRRSAPSARRRRPTAGSRSCAGPCCRCSRTRRAARLGVDDRGRAAEVVVIPDRRHVESWAAPRQSASVYIMSPVSLDRQLAQLRREAHPAVGNERDPVEAEAEALLCPWRDVLEGLTGLGPGLEAEVDVGGERAAALQRSLYSRSDATPRSRA